MATVASLFFGLAVLLVAMTGLAMTLGADKLRDALARGAAGATVVAIFLPYAGRVLAGVVDHVGDVFHGNTGAHDDYYVNTFGVAAFVAGHAGLAGAWLYARFGPPTFIENIERSRGRGRERVMPALMPEVDRE